MPATATRKQRKASIEETARQVEVSPEAAHQLVSILESVRQGYLDALPIAAAMVTVGDGETYIECANDLFRFVAEWDERLGDRHIRHVPLLRSGPVGTRLAAFLTGGEAAHQFETAEFQADQPGPKPS